MRFGAQMIATRGQPRALARLGSQRPSGVVVPVATALPRVATVVAKWSSDTAPVQADGATVTTWTDEINGAVATATGAPLYKTNRLNSKPSIQFPGGTVRMEVSGATALIAALDTTIYSVLIVVKGVTATSNGTPFSASAGGNSIAYQANGTVVGRVTGNNRASLPNAASSYTTFGNTSATGSHNGSGTGLERYYCQGGCYTSNVAAAPGTAGKTITLGNIAGGNSSFGFKGEIFDIIVWSVELTPTEMIQAHKWADEKYNQAHPWTTAGKMTIFDGDSITAGVGIATSDNVSTIYPYKAAQTLGLPLGAWSNLGIGGITMANMNAKAAVEVDAVAALTGVPTHLAVFEWYNQKAASPTPANNSVTYLQARASAGITKITFGTATDEATNRTNLAAYNAYWDTNHATYSQAYAAIHLDLNIGVAGTCTNTTYFAADAIHLVPLGYTSLASVFSTAMATL